MNRAKRKQIHTALVNALADLAGPDDFRHSIKNQYICYAIEDSNQNAKLVTTEGGQLAVKLIAERIWPAFSLESWVMQQGIPEEELTWENMQAHRHAWLKLLIKEFSK
jgi:hypothetical protein